MFDKQKGRQLMNRKFVLVLFLIFCAYSVFAGDVADYVNLGFSDNSEFFMFGQYGIEYKSSNPYAEIYTVKVSENRFADKGVYRKLSSIAMQPGQDGSGALFNLLRDNNESLKVFNINHLNKGRIVYLLINGAEPKNTLEFRDFKNNGRYKVTLVQEQFGTEKDPSSSFYIDLTVTDKTNTISTYKIGLPDFKERTFLNTGLSRLCSLLMKNLWFL